MNFNAKKIEKVLKIRLKNKLLLSESLTHKSANKEKNNEKLEFLGDRVIGLAISKKLILMYPDEKEGIIDKRFANLVNKKTCAKVFRELNLKKYIKTGSSYKNLRTSDEKILSDSCEALIGAVYLDQGFIISEKFVLNIWKTSIQNSQIIKLDPKTKLQEYSLQKYKIKKNKKLPI